MHVTWAQPGGQSNREIQSRRQIVYPGKAEVYSGEKKIAELPSGRIVETTALKKPWHLVPVVNGWVHSSQILPLDQAAQKLDEQLAEQPTPQRQHLRGIIALETGDLPGAIKHLQAAREAGLNDAALLTNLGNAFQEAGEMQQALNCFTEALKQDPMNANTYENRAGLLSQMGQHRASLADSNRSIALDPTRPDAFNNRGVTFQAIGDSQSALKDFSEAIRLRPDDIDAYSNRALCQFEQQNWKAARADYQSILKYDPNHQETLNELAWLLATCPDETVRDGARAVQLATQVNELSGHSDPDYLDTLAAAYAESGDFKRAVATQKSALRNGLTDEAGGTERLKLYENKTPFRERQLQNASQ